MRHNLLFNLPLPGPMLRYALSWDDETGELTGEHAQDVMDWATLAREEGVIHCDELGGDIPATDPLKVKAEFCALIGRDRLPDSLKAFYPTRDYPGFVAFDDVEAGVFTPDIDVVF